MEKNDSYVFLTEQVYYDRSYIQEILIDDSEVFEKLNSLSFTRISDRGQISFSYVGVISLKRSIICVFPKYYRDVPEQRNIEAMILIIKVLKRAGQMSDITPDFENISTLSRGESTELAIADQLIRDFLEHGFYTREIGQLELNNIVEIDWVETISKLDPIISRGCPIYVDTYGRIFNTTDGHLVTEIQKWALKYLLSKYGLLLDYQFGFFEECVNDPSELGTMDYLTYTLTKELTTEFTDRNINLLKSLLGLLNKAFTSSVRPFNVYGTGYFHVIWELVCAHSFRNEINAFKNYIPQPVWNDHFGNKVAKDTFRPDIIWFNSISNVLFLLDAKYYGLTFFTNPFRVLGNPGIGDISKQFLYEKAFELKGFMNIVNVLLFPRIQLDAIDNKGFLSFDLFPNKHLHVCFIKPEIVFQNFIDGISLNDEAFKLLTP